ncbi:unnamed protein product, partial [Iphiclides podalirius]
MGRSRFPGKPLKFQNRKRISVLSGAVYHETTPESHPAARGSGGNDFTGEKEEEEKKENNNENEANSTSENKVTSEGLKKNKQEAQENGSDLLKSPVRTRSQNKMEPSKDGEEQTTTSNSLCSGKVLKKPKLKRVVFNNLHDDDDSPEEGECDKKDKEKNREKSLMASSNLFKGKTANSFSTINTGSRKPLLDLFAIEKGLDFPSDENSNVESLDKLKPTESKEERTGHAMRKLMDISDASSSPSTSSGSESEESWESESPPGSGDEEEKPASISPEKDKSNPSQLLRGKVIIREARLQLNTTTPSNTGLDGPFSTVVPSSSPNPPTTVTCGVCGAVRFYRFVKQARKFGIYSCESCRKFISKMLKKEKMSQRTGPVVMQCLKGEGNCHVPPIVRSQQWKLLRCTNKTRCPACWLKMCLKAFQVPPNLRASLTAMLPPHMRASAKPSGPLTQANPLRITGNTTSTSPPIFSATNTTTTLTTENEKLFGNLKSIKKVSEDVEKQEEKIQESKVDEESNEDFSNNRKRRLTRIKVRKKDKNDVKQTEDPKRQKMELKGPRVKHVCRSASIVLGQPIATFPTQEEKDKPEKSISSDDDINTVPITDKENGTPDLSSCESEIDAENKPLQTTTQIVTSKEFDTENQTESKKRKIEMPISSKPLNKMESSEDEIVMDLIPKKSIQKPLSNITNIRGRSQKCGQNRPELICVDFWESYDPDEVCSSGFGLIGTAPFTVARLCFLCGSAGSEKMLVCSSCCEWYHGWCAEDAGRSASSGEWTCARCVACAVCSRAAARLRCRSCARHHHAACLVPAPPDHRSDWPQICSACLKCKSCDNNRVNKFVGSLPFCRPCFKLRQKGNYCPLCQACYRDNDFDSKMMECGWCGRWVHASCEDVAMEKEDIPHTSHKVVNLQEPLMQNKEICFSTGLYNNKTEFSSSCVEVHENYSPQIKTEKAMAMLPTTIHDDKYEAISDDDEPVKSISQASSAQDLSPALIRQTNLVDEDITETDFNRIVSPSLLDIKRRVNSDEYISLKDFNHDMKDVIVRTSNEDLRSIYKELFCETFPWFDCENNCLQPNLEVEGYDYGVNITVDHTLDVQIVERAIAEIGAWHESLETVSNTVRMLKNDKSPIKYGNSVTLEDLAVKQVVEYLLDNVCKQEQQDEEEPQNTADLLPPEVKDAIFEDLNHDLLDGISMQDIFPKLMSYEDLVAMDLKNEFYGAMSQSDDKSDSRSTDFIDELLNARLESGNKELKRSKSEMLLQNHNLKTLTTGRGQQRSTSLTWNNKFDTSLLSSTIKRCKMGKSSTVTGKLSPVQRTTITENTLECIKENERTSLEKKPKSENVNNSEIAEEAAHSSGINYRSTTPKEKEDPTKEKADKTEGYYTDVIDFYTKIQCSPISQLDGAADWSGSESTCSSRPNSPREDDFTPIQQLDGADDHPGNDMQRNHTNQFLYRASGTESTYTVTIAGNAINGQPELVMRPLDDGSGAPGQMEQLVRCDRCQCTYRNKESYDRHIPSCDMMSTSESESENPKSPENRTLTTLQNAFQGAFAQPMVIHAGVVSGTENSVKAEGISARRTSINTRQITINGTIVETPSPGPANEMTMTITEQMKSGTVIFDQSKTTNVQVSANQQVLSSPQIVVTPQMLLPPKTSTSSGQKIMTPQIITQPGILPYNICVKPGNGNANIQQIQGGADMTQLLSGAGGIQVISSNSNQVLTIPSNQPGNIAPMIQGKNHVTSFPNMASASSIALPVNSIQGMPNTSIIQNIQPMIRPQIQGNPTIVVPAMTAQRLASPNSQNKQHIILPGTPQKSPKKQPPPVQPKPIFQAANRGRGRPLPKPTTIKRQTKLEKTFTTINQSPLGPGNTVIQLQTNNQTGQPSIIVQPVANQNIMSAYVEALSQQQNQNMQYIATIAPQGDFKTGPTQFISQSGLMPQTFQIQQTESGGLVAVPSGGIPVLLPQGNVGILPQAIQQGATILPQGTIQAQGIISQGPNGPTILPQAIHTQNGTTIIPQGTIQGLAPGTITSQTATLLPNNTLHTAGATVVPQSGIGNGQTTIIPNGALPSQGNALISSAPGATILPQGTLLPQFCNDQVLLGSTPTLEMVTDPSGCMYLTTTQPVYYGLETIVQNTVMSSQQFVSTAMQGVLAQNSSFSATTTQVFQASKIEPIVEVPTGYVVVNNVGESVSTQAASSTPNVVTAQTVQSTPQPLKTVKTSVPNLTLQPLPDKQQNNVNRQTSKVIQMSPAPLTQNSTINLPTQNSTSITLPKAPPTQQSGIPTNIVNPMSMRPMNRVLPLHRDGQSKSAKNSSASKTAPVPKQRPAPTVSHDMPDLNVKEETVDSDLEKAIEESKRMLQLERAKREKEERDAARAIQLSAEMQQANTSAASANVESRNHGTIEAVAKMTSLPSLDTVMEVEAPKVLVEKDINRSIQNKMSNASSKVIKRPLNDKKTEKEAVVSKKHSKLLKGQENKTSQPKQICDPPKDDGPKLIYEVTSEDGFNYSSSSLTDLWTKVIEAVQNARKLSGLPLIQYNLPSTLSGAHLLGLNNNALRYLIEQLPGASRCTKYKIRQGRPLSSWDNDLDLSEGFKESPWGSARTGPIARKQNHDMFSWMASPFREEPPPFGGQEGESLISRRLATLPPAMRFRQLKETSKASVGVYRSHIHGRGLFCKRDIEEGDMVIEYAGEVIRAVLADQREKRYEAMSGRRGVGGCYMFRIDDNLVVDATLKGNAARFINHSCDPNCYSRVVDIHGHKHILIFALRRITVGEELTYDYKFPFEEVKIPCTCGAKKCRKYLN